MATTEQLNAQTDRDLVLLLNEAGKNNDIEAIQKIYDILNQQEEIYLENRLEWFFCSVPPVVLNRLNL